MQTDHTFTSMQLITTIANWKLNPLTRTEINYLLKELATKQTWSYGENDPESLLLEILSELTLSASSLEDSLIEFIKIHPYLIQQNAEFRSVHKPIHDRTEISIHTPSGEYERITITINYIA